tara:strand:+ start:358 stop:573 length:216 start_codon:yes stop_codon:yes gene_type:complete
MACMSGDQITSSEFNQANLTINKTSRKSKKVDINILLNKVRVAQKKEKFENTIFFGLVAMSVVVTGIIVSL